jgi:hypothetical protein
MAQVLKPLKNKFIYDTLMKVQSGVYPAPARPPQFRVSSLPFCPLLFALDSKKHNPDKPDEVEFKSGFYFKQGHALHSLWQETSSHMVPEEIIGDWQCNHILKQEDKGDKQTITRCNRLLPFCSAKEMLKVKCPHGKKDCEASQIYAELEFEWCGLAGHSDLLLREKKTGRYHVVDWKTTGLFLFDKPKIAMNMGYYPSKKYIEQIETYCVLLEWKFKIKIHSYTIAYISRDRAQHDPKNKKPALHLFSYQFTKPVRTHRIAKMKVYRSRFKIVQRVLDKPNKVGIKKLYESRPCHTMAQYTANMKHGFFDGCDFAKDRSCFNNTMLKRLKKELL